jgi:hypothetical protein
LLGGQFVRNRMRRKTSQAKGSVVLAGLVNKRMALRGENKGVKYSATLRKDGHISYKGEIFTSPSMAGRAAIGRHVNGWLFWSYKAGKKGWVSLGTLRT